MTEHTKEPWSTKAWMYGVIRIFSGSKYIACVDNTDDNEAQHSVDARRIVACVNACDGIETELLESLSISHELTIANKKNNLLTKQRNAAEEALYQAKERAERGHHGDLIACDITIALANIETMS